MMTPFAPPHRRVHRLVLLILLATLPLTTARAKPNIIWIYTDDHAIQALSAYGGNLAEIAPTPAIDRLATEGMRFDRSYVANSICGPARACVLTGQHSHNNGVLDNRPGPNGRINYDKVVTFPQVLQKSGYATAIFGKWHLATLPEGFDQWAVLPGQGQYYNTQFIIPGDQPGSQEREIHHGQHSSELIMNKTLAYLKEAKQADKPFMLMCQFKAPHRSWLPAPELADAFQDTIFPEPETLLDDYATRGVAAHKQQMTLLRWMHLENDLKFQSKGYPVANADFAPPNNLKDPILIAKMKADNATYQAVYGPRKRDFKANPPTGDDLVKWKYQAYLQDYLACIKGVDQQVARLLTYLDESGLAENTIVAYSSDQGFYLGEHGWFDKRFMYEESFRTPLLVRWPGHIKPGSVNRDLVQNIDMASTFLEIAKAEALDDVDGVSILPLLQGERPADWRENLYYHYYEYPGPHAVRRHEGVFGGRYKLIRFYGAGVPNDEEWEFYDLEKDPRELNNCYASPELAEAIRSKKQALKKLRAQYHVPEQPPVQRNSPKAKSKPKAASKKP